MTKWINVHIPKCAGTTFTGILQRNFGSGFADGRSYLSDRLFKYNAEHIADIFSTYKWIRCFSDHKCTTNTPEDRESYRTLVFVRDPVERFLSHYYYCRERAREGIVFDLEAAELGLSDYVEEVLYKHAKPDLRNGLCYHTFGRLEEETYEEKIQEIDHEQIIFLPMEEFDDACIFLETAFPEIFKDCSYTSQNIGFSKGAISDEIRSRILQGMFYDRMLYERATKVFKQRINNLFCSEEGRKTTRKNFRDRCSVRNRQKELVETKSRRLNALKRVARKICKNIGFKTNRYNG